MKATITLLPLSCAAILGLALVGCEVETASSATQTEILVTPSSASLHKGQSVEFVATGWHEYTWSLQYNTWGSISRKTGDRTVYTSLNSTNGAQILTVSASVTGTNQVQSVSREILIFHE